ncbi:hypothetical protein JS530_03315 [Bifidobacterium sp. LC6]|uniref:WXG100 family type VII secretion target n=1 Tax=Bifidobacterium colobi TaxID=2809026 RepID=A0ABS5UU11_9BIFI|nr:hypothetical protein [Bifidobacterium colobi]MBT1174547.1 hypothetical protein [Bifidobacterium colobi]
MANEIHVDGDRVRAEAANLLVTGKDIKDGVGAQWDGSTRSDPNEFEKGMEDYLQQAAHAFQQSRANLEESLRKYSESLSRSVAEIEKGEQSQEEALAGVKAQVEAAADTQFESEKDKDSLREILKPLDELLGTDFSGKVPDTEPLTEVPMPPNHTGSVPLPPKQA